MGQACQGPELGAVLEGEGTAGRQSAKGRERRGSGARGVQGKERGVLKPCPEPREEWCLP